MDYTSGPYSVTFPAGVMSVPFNISINDDSVMEFNERLSLSIKLSLKLRISFRRVTLGKCKVIIVDNDCKLEHDISS